MSLKLIISSLFLTTFRTLSQSCDWDADQTPLPSSDPYSAFQSTSFWSYDQSTTSWKIISFTTSCPSPSSSPASVEQQTSQALETSESEVPDWLSMMKFSERSLWITGHSGSLYEKFWNGVRWVIIPHHVRSSAGVVVACLFSVNRTLLALSQQGKLFQVLLVPPRSDSKLISVWGFQLQGDANGELEWSSAGPWELSGTVELRKSAVLSGDETSLFFASATGSLLELSSLHPVARWINHSQPRGGDVAQVVDAGSLRTGWIFTVSSSGDLYEYNPASKPAWKKHVRSESMAEHELAPVKGVVVYDLAGTRSFSMFLMTKSGLLLERRLARSKWTWLLHPKPQARLSFSLGPVVLTPKNTSFFLVSGQGSVYEYKLSHLHGNNLGEWKYHSHPADASVMPSVPGVVLYADHTFFMLRDGRVAELSSSHSWSSQTSRKNSIPPDANLEWIVHEAPESEGGNADYCSASLGPSNCLEGIDIDDHSSGYRDQEETFTSGFSSGSFRWNGSTSSLFRARALQFGKSMFLVGEDGVPSERFLKGKLWLWLKHEVSSTSIAGILGAYNGSVFMNDVEGSLMTREWNGASLHWINCSALQNGFKVVSGSPADGLLGEVRTVTLEDAIMFVSDGGELIEFLVALRNFTWRSCGHPPGSPVAAIVDQEAFRYRVVFVVGFDGKLYHFNRITRQWSGYSHQPEQLKLSGIPGSVCRSSFQSTEGSLFMRSESGNLAELSWTNQRGWRWFDHGSPGEGGCYVATSPGPCMENGDVLVVGSDGRVYARKRVDERWVWQDLGHPLVDQSLKEKRVVIVEDGSNTGEAEVMISFEGHCDFLIDSVRPVAMDRDLVSFVLRDGRIAELKHVEEQWDWVSIIDTPTSRCHSSYYQQF